MIVKLVAPFGLTPKWVWVRIIILKVVPEAGRAHHQVYAKQPLFLIKYEIHINLKKILIIRHAT